MEKRQDTAEVVFLPEPGACAGRLDPGQNLVPEALAELVDYHVWPSASPTNEVSGRARTVCEHIDYELIWQEHPEWFDRRAQVGIPAFPQLWEAKWVLAEFGVSLAYDVQFEQIQGELALAVYGAGVVGRLSTGAWHAVAGLLTTCCSMLHEPLAGLAPRGRLLRPARRLVVTGAAGCADSGPAGELGDRGLDPHLVGLSVPRDLGRRLRVPRARTRGVGRPVRSGHSGQRVTTSAGARSRRRTASRT